MINVNDLGIDEGLRGQVGALQGMGMSGGDAAMSLGARREMGELLDAENKAPGDLTPQELELIKQQLFATALTSVDENARLRAQMFLYEHHHVSAKERLKAKSNLGQTNILVIAQKIAAAQRLTDGNA